MSASIYKDFWKVTHMFLLSLLQFVGNVRAKVANDSLIRYFVYVRSSGLFCLILTCMFMWYTYRPAQSSSCLNSILLRISLTKSSWSDRKSVSSPWTRSWLIPTPLQLWLQRIGVFFEVFFTGFKKNLANKIQRNPLRNFQWNLWKKFKSFSFCNFWKNRVRKGISARIV